MTPSEIKKKDKKVDELRRSLVSLGYALVQPSGRSLSIRNDYGGRVLITLPEPNTGDTSIRIKVDHSDGEAKDISFGSGHTSFSVMRVPLRFEEVVLNVVATDAVSRERRAIEKRLKETLAKVAPEAMR